jgi:hypothetical protein
MKIGHNRLVTGGAPLFVTMPLMRKVRHAVILGQEIWQFGQMCIRSQGTLYDDMEVFESDIQEALREGVVNMDSNVSSPWSDPAQVFGDAFTLIVTSKRW